MGTTHPPVQAMRELKIAIYSGLINKEKAGKKAYHARFMIHVSDSFNNVIVPILMSFFSSIEILLNL